MRALLIALIIALAAAPAFGASINLAWTAPTTNEDGSALDDLAGHYVYCTDIAGEYSDPICKIDVGMDTSATVEMLVDGGTYFFVVTAYDDNLNESDPSNEVSNTFPYLCPSPPGGLTIVP